MLPIIHQSQDFSELRKIHSLLRLQRMLLEERNDMMIQVIQTANPISHSIAVIRANHTAPKKLFERVKQLNVSFVLHNCELRKHLESGSHLRVRINADEEASFSIYKSDHPLCFQPPRLWLNVKSLRVLHLEPSLRIVPLSAGF
jgi:hypothetical protein